MGLHKKNDKAIKIIHLTRDNLLRVHISRLIAGKNQLWVNDKNLNLNVEDRRVEIDIDEFFEDVKRTKSYIREVGEVFSEHQILNVKYEELVSNRAVVMKRIFEFLSVNPLISKTNLKKQNSESIKELVSNFDELKLRLKSTEYEWMIND